MLPLTESLTNNMIECTQCFGLLSAFTDVIFINPRGGYYHHSYFIDQATEGRESK